MSANVSDNWSSNGWITSLLKKGTQLWWAGALWFDAVNSLNLPAIWRTSNIEWVGIALWTGKMPITKAFIDWVNGVISSRSITDPQWLATIVWATALWTAIVGGRNIKKWKKWRWITQVAGALVAWIDASNISSGNWFALIRWTKDLVTRWVNSLLTLWNAVTPETLSVATKIIQIGAPALYTALSIYLLNKIWIFDSKEKKH